MENTTLTQLKYSPTSLRQAREDKGLTLQEVATRVGVQKQRLHEYETGKARPYADIMARLCLFYQKPIEFFCSE